MSISPTAIDSISTDAAATVPQKEAAAFLARQHGRIVLHTPEITLKGHNQKDFQQALKRNVRHRLQRAGLHWPVGGGRGRAYVDISGRSAAEIGRALELLGQVSGVSSLAAAVWLRPGELRTGSGAPDWDRLGNLAVALAQVWYRPGQSFAMNVRHVDKSFPAGSHEMCARLGDVIRARTDWNDVNLDAPDRTFHFDVYPDGLYVYAEKHPGIGGLPSGTGGHMLALLSGGIDSPVAAFQLARRGAGIDFFHMSAGHATAADLEASVVGRLAARVSCYSQRSRLFAVPYTFFDLALAGDQRGYELILFRRFLLRAAENLAARIGTGALITGDCLGQVASQTLENIAVVSAAGRLPVFRPLIGTNKTEIIDLARRIGTYDISIEPYKDCCALLASSPRTRARIDEVERIEAERLTDYPQLIERTLEEAVCIEYDCGEALRHTTLAEAVNQSPAR